MSLELSALAALEAVDDFEALNNAIIRGSFLLHSSADWQKLADDWQTNVVSQRTSLSVVPPVWAGVLVGYWNRYAQLYSAQSQAQQAQLMNPYDVAPGGVSKALKDLWAPAQDSAQNVKAAAEAALAAKARELGKEAAGGAQEAISWKTYLLWGAAAVGVGGLVVTLLQRPRVR